MKKLLIGTLLAMLLAMALVAPAAAQTTTPITGQVQTITVVTDAGTGVTTVAVTLTDSAGATQTVSLSLETATALGLVTTDPATGEPVADTTKVGTDVSIDPAAVIPEVPEEEEGDQHPVGSALADFFADVTGVDYDTVMGYHEEGTGFGVIAQALWLNTQLGGDAATFDAIMQAKMSGDFSAIVLPDGSTPQNWGQFRQAVLKDKEDSKHNLGSVMSGRADDEDEKGNGKGNGKGNEDVDEDGSDGEAATTGNGNGGNGNGGNGNGGNGNDNGNGKDKDKDKGKGNNKP